MSDNDQFPTCWGIHGGRAGEANSLFLRKNVVALGWAKMRDISVLPANREAFKAAVVAIYPGLAPGAIPTQAGQFYRFVHEMKEGDLVIYPSKIDRKVHLGVVKGPYRHTPQDESEFPHQRAVKWLAEFPRTRFSQGALYEIGSALSLFQVRNYADEFRAAAKGKPAPLPVAQDESVSVVADEIAETTRDFVLKTLAQELKGHPMAEFVAHLLNAMGYRTRLSPEGPDGGVDILAHKDELGFEPPIVKVQVKSTEGSVGDPLVSALYGKVGTGEFGLLVTLGTFTHQARTFARNRTNLRLIDGNELVDLVLDHYEQLDSRYKGLLPLRRVYVPERIEEGKE